MRTLGAVRIPKPDLEKLARVLLTLAPPNADPWELVHVAALRWDDLNTWAIGTIVERAQTIREERAIVGGNNKNTPEVRAAAAKLTTELVAAGTDQPKKELFERVVTETGLDGTFGGWQTLYYYPAKKALAASPPEAEVPEESTEEPEQPTPAGNDEGRFGGMLDWLGDRHRTAKARFGLVEKSYRAASLELAEIEGAMKWVRTAMEEAEG